MTLHPTRRLQDGRYILLGLLRTGGEAEVWRALDTVAGEQRALKVWLAADGGAEAAARELELARRVVHPHVVRVDDAFVDGDHAFVVMELAEGSLAERVATMGPLTPAEAFAALEGPLAALEAAHAAGIVHRDVKPHNLLVFGALDGAFDGALHGALERDGGGRPRAIVKLADFGIAQVRAEGLTRTRSGAFLGSLPFMSPEQRRDPRNVGPATDVYAAAVTLAWLVTGKAPGDLYLPETLAELRGELRGRGLEKREIERVVGVVEAGGRLEAGGRAGVGEPGTGGEWRRSRVSRGWRFALLALGCVAAMAVAGTAMRERWQRPSTKEQTIPECESIIADWAPTVAMGPEETVAVSIGDADSDGTPDVLFTNQLAETVTIWWGQRGAMPREHVDQRIGRSNGPARVGDVNGDGIVDIVVPLPDDTALGLLRGEGSRRFGTVTLVFQGPVPHSPVLLDWNNDGLSDVVFAEALAPERSSYARTASDGTWTPHALLGGTLGVPLLASGPQSVITATNGSLTHVVLDNMGQVQSRTDIGFASDDWTPLGFLGEWLYMSDRNGGLVRTTTHGERPCRAGTLPDDLGRWGAAADLDGDGVLDVAGFDGCRACTSNQIFVRGMMSAASIAPAPP